MASDAAVERLSPLRAVECGIGLAPGDLDCQLCMGRDAACPVHTAEHVIEFLRDEGYVIVDAAEAKP